MDAVDNCYSVGYPEGRTIQYWGGAREWMFQRLVTSYSVAFIVAAIRHSYYNKGFCCSALNP